MTMNRIIYEKRKELGLTQEQVADYLNVSVPAVSKWEKGSTSPDISLLPPLARLLNVDLNTLFCFEKDLSPKEAGDFCRKVASMVQTAGIAAGFEAAERKIHEYPHNEYLLHCLTILLDARTAMANLPADETDRYERKITQWYQCLAKSADNKIRNSAQYMMASRFIHSGDYDRAQEIVDAMPDPDHLTESMADKRMLQINICLQRGDTTKAITDLQYALLASIHKTQILLYKMVDAELASGNTQAARDIADKSDRMTALFDLWEYNAFVAPLQTAMAEKNASECIRLLRKMTAAIRTPWDTGRSALFYRIAKTFHPDQMLQAFLSGLNKIMEQDPSYDFLKAGKEYDKLVAECRTWMEKRTGL